MNNILIYYKPEIFLKDIKEIAEKEKDENTKRYLCMIEESIHLNIPQFMKECKQKTYPYALCLSEKKDNLTHWDRYAVNCTGVCIGVNISALRVLMQRLAITGFGVGVYDVGKILYASDQKEKCIKKALINIANMLSKADESDSNNIMRLIRKNGYIYAVSAYMQTAKFVKDDSFIDEDEVRLYHDSTSIKSTIRLIDSLLPDLDQELQVNLKKHFNDFVTSLHIGEEKF